jgi:hypothetical protein
VTHTFSIAKARQAFGYNPVAITRQHWDDIVQSYRLKTD